MPTVTMFIDIYYLFTLNHVNKDNLYGYLLVKYLISLKQINIRRIGLNLV